MEQKYCEECNEKHYVNSFCESCNACLYKNYTQVEDPIYPLVKCEKCNKVNFWDWRITYMLKKIARIFEDVNGYYICDENSDVLDTRGRVYNTKISAMQAALQGGYTHAIGSGTYWGNKIRSLSSFVERKN